MNRKGQALIEFVVVIPVFLILILSVVDFGNILLSKYQLESDLDFVREMYQNNELIKLKKFVDENEIDYEIDKVNDEIVIKKEIKITVPGLNKILGNPYEIEVKGFVYEK